LTDADAAGHSIRRELVEFIRDLDIVGAAHARTAAPAFECLLVVDGGTDFVLF
jgi:hypothetical protein